MQACGNPDALQRLILNEFFANTLQHRHRLIGPFDAPLALVGELHAFYVARNLSCDCCSHDLLVEKAAVTSQRLRSELDVSVERPRASSPIYFAVAAIFSEAPADLRAAALSVASHVNSDSLRPKWPYAAVFL